MSGCAGEKQLRELLSMTESQRQELIKHLVGNDGDYELKQKKFAEVFKKDAMTIDKLIEICKREYLRGLATAKCSKFDDGYATAFKLCLSFARELKDAGGTQ